MAKRAEQSPEAEQIKSTVEVVAEEAVSNRIGQFESENRLLRGIMMGVIVVLGLGFITLLFALWPIYLEAQTRRRIIDDVLRNQENILSEIHALKKTFGLDKELPRK